MPPPPLMTFSSPHRKSLNHWVYSPLPLSLQPQSICFLFLMDLPLLAISHKQNLTMWPFISFPLIDEKIEAQRGWGPSAGKGRSQVLEPPHLTLEDYPHPPELVFLPHPLRILFEFKAKQGKGGASRKKSACQCRRLKRSIGVRNGNPIQCSCLENSLDREARQVIVHGAAKSQTRLSTWE